MEIKTTFLRRPIEINQNSWKANSFHWWITLTQGDESHSFEFFMGPAHVRKNKSPKRPKLLDVLECLQNDARSGQELFEDFCCDLGLNEDSRDALNTYLACQQTFKHLRRLFGGNFSQFIETDQEDLETFLEELKA